jgi:PAS domain S-box-containing protein
MVAPPIGHGLSLEGYGPLGPLVRLNILDVKSGPQMSRIKEQPQIDEIRRKRLLEATGVIPWEADAQTWRFTYVGPQAKALLGYSVDEWYEEDFWPSHMHPEDRDFAMKLCETCSKTVTDYEFEYRMIAADGRAVWLHDVVNVVTEEGAPRLLQGFMIDITDRKLSEEALREAHEQLEARVEEVAQLKDQLEVEKEYLREEIKHVHNFDEIVGSSGAIQAVFESTGQVSRTNATVLLFGETGTGKELFARAIHANSERHGRALIKVDCATLPDGLVESELFGHAKGAFTGADASRAGRFELADGGTIFLDEIGELSAEVQAKLLRVLQEGEIQRLGAREVQKVDVRVIVATNRNLKREVEEGRFRADLFYRLNVFPIEIPPLRHRREDIPLLTAFLIPKCAARLGKRIERVPLGVQEALAAYDWPGNVRELQNVIERSVILSHDGALELAEDLGESSVRSPAEGASLKQNLEDLERRNILRTLEDCNWKIKGEANAAKQLGLNPSTLRSRMKRLGISRSSSSIQ